MQNERERNLPPLDLEVRQCNNLWSVSISISLSSSSSSYQSESSSCREIFSTSSSASLCRTFLTNFLFGLFVMVSFDNYLLLASDLCNLIFSFSGVSVAIKLRPCFLLLILALGIALLGCLNWLEFMKDNADVYFDVETQTLPEKLENAL